MQLMQFQMLVVKGTQGTDHSVILFTRVHCHFAKIFLPCDWPVNPYQRFCGCCYKTTVKPLFSRVESEVLSVKGNMLVIKIFKAISDCLFCLPRCFALGWEVKILIWCTVVHTMARRTVSHWFLVSTQSMDELLICKFCHPSYSLLSLIRRSALHLIDYKL